MYHRKFETVDAFLGQVNSPYVGLNFDIGHFYCMNEDPSELVRDHHLSYLEHFHIEDIAKNRVHNHLIPGQGSIDFRSVLRSIMKKGYDGYLTVELHTNQPNPEQAGKISYNYLSRVRRDLST